MKGSVGRPVKSEIREHVAEILAVHGPSYGYEVFKMYSDSFFPCTRESIYYHLKKGVELGMFKISKISSEKGDFSWGDTAEKTFYEVIEPKNVIMSGKVKKE